MSTLIIFHFLIFELTEPDITQSSLVFIMQFIFALCEHI